MSGQCILLDNRRLVSQISTLQRQTTAGGRDKVDHAKGSQDDLANAALGVLVCATGTAGRQVPEWVQQDLASGRESYTVADADPLAAWNWDGGASERPSFKNGGVDRYGRRTAQARWSTVEADADPLGDF
jgi:hypothetical protein